MAAVNSKGAGDKSAEIEFHTEVAVVPQVPTDLEVSIDTEYITVSWTAPLNGGSPITGYTVNFKTADGLQAVNENCTPFTKTVCVFNVNTLVQEPFLL